MRIALLEASHWHVPLYLDALSLPGIEIVAVSDRETLHGPAVAARFGCPFYRSYQELLERTQVDFAFAFGRHVDMPAIGNALIDRGISFAIEKPCGTNAASVAQLRARAEAARLYVAVPFMLRVGRMLPAIIAAEGALPTRVHHAHFRFAGGPPSRYVDAGAAWMLDPTQSGGGCTINVGTHFVDLFRHLTGSDVKRVSAVMNSRGHGAHVEDYSIVVMTAADGTVGTVETSYTFPSGEAELREFSFALSTDTNYFRSTTDGMLLTRRSDPGDNRTSVVPIDLAAEFLYGHYVERVLADFAAGRRPVAGLAEAEAVMRVLDAAYASAKLGGAVQQVG